MTEVLTIDGLRLDTVHDGHRHDLVRGVTLDLRRGEILALVGASGSGKSLTCGGAQGVLPPGVRQTAGRVLIDGAEVPPDRLRGRQIANILQSPRSAFNPILSMRGHARETLSAIGTLTPDADARILAALEDVGLEDGERVLRHYAFEMSGGMLQRFMIALAVLSGAPFLFADEPTTDLDLVVQAAFLT